MKMKQAKELMITAVMTGSSLAGVVALGTVSVALIPQAAQAQDFNGDRVLRDGIRRGERRAGDLLERGVDSLFDGVFGDPRERERQRRAAQREYERQARTAQRNRDRFLKDQAERQKEQAYKSVAVRYAQDFVSLNGSRINEKNQSKALRECADQVALKIQFQDSAERVPTRVVADSCKYVFSANGIGGPGF